MGTKGFKPQFDSVFKNFYFMLMKAIFFQITGSNGRDLFFISPNELNRNPKNMKN